MAGQTYVIRPETQTTVRVEEDKVTVVRHATTTLRAPVVRGADGPPGPQGPPGPGGAGETHQQQVASAVWSIPHSLGYFPAVTVFDTTGDEIVGAIKHITVALVEITFSAPVSGVAYLS